MKILVLNSGSSSQKACLYGIGKKYCAGRAAQLLGKDLNSLRLVTCHLGNGCSMAAIQAGHSVGINDGGAHRIPFVPWPS